MSQTVKEANPLVGGSRTLRRWARMVAHVSQRVPDALGGILQREPHDPGPHHPQLPYEQAEHCLAKAESTFSNCFKAFEEHRSNSLARLATTSQW